MFLRTYNLQDKNEETKRVRKCAGNVLTDFIFSIFTYINCEKECNNCFHNFSEERDNVIVAKQ